jgi:glutamate 5-kinase
MRLVVKIGSSSLTDDDGVIASESIHKLSVELAQLRALGHEVVVVSSGPLPRGCHCLASMQLRVRLTQQRFKPSRQSDRLA